MRVKFLFFLLLSFAVFTSIAVAQMSSKNASALTPVKDGNREADRSAIRERVDNNFKSYVNKDRDKARALSLGNYNLVEFEIFFQNDTALICYVANIKVKNGGKTSTDKYHILDVYSKRNGEWIQISNPMPSYSAFTLVSTEARKIILDEREKVWRAWFTNDKAALEKAIPEEIIIISPGQGDLKHRAEVLESSERFVKNGSKLVRLEFPKDEIQVYGSTIILYTTYLFEVETNGKRQITAGRATDMFVVRDNKFVNVGWHLDSGK